MNSALRVGIIGAGWWATTNHLPILAARTDVELVAVCRPGSSELELVKETFGFKYSTHDYKELLELDLDAVVVSSPHYLHYEHAGEALKRGLHTLCEKPLTLEPRHGWELAELAEQSGCHLMVPFGWNYTPFIQDAKRALQENSIGIVEHVQCFMASPTKEFFAGVDGVPAQWTGGIAAPDPTTWQDPAKGGGYAHGQLSHAVALLLWAFDLRARAVCGAATSSTAEVDLYNSAIVEFTNGAVGSVGGAATLPMGSKFQVDIRVFGSEGVFLLDTERERAEIRLHDGRRWRAANVAEGEGDYACINPVVRFVELARGLLVQNDSSGILGARTVELVSALLKSSQQSMHTVSINQMLGQGLMGESH